MKVKVTLAALLMTAVFFKGVLFHLDEIFIVNPLPVARFEHAVPYVVFCLATLLLNQGFQICHFDMPHNKTAWWSFVNAFQNLKCNAENC